MDHDTELHKSGVDRTAARVDDVDVVLAYRFWANSDELLHHGEEPTADADIRLADVVFRDFSAGDRETDAGDDTQTSTRPQKKSCVPVGDDFRELGVARPCWRMSRGTTN
jgi:hypothetical protein